MATRNFTCTRARILVSTPQPQSISALWLILILPSHGRRRVEGWVDLGGCLHTEINCRTRESNPDTVTYPSTNRAQRRLTSLIETNALPLNQTHEWQVLKHFTGGWPQRDRVNTERYTVTSDVRKIALRWTDVTAAEQDRQWWRHWVTQCIVREFVVFGFKIL